MERVKAFAAVAASLLAAGVMTAAVARAESTPLPSLHTALPGEAYPLVLAGASKGNSELLSETAGVLKTTELSILYLASELTSLGQAIITFLGVETPESQKCHSEGDSEADGAVLIPGAEFHLVYTSLSPATKLEVGELLSFEPHLLIVCDGGASEASLLGPATQRISANAAEGQEGDSASMQIASHCGGTSAVQEIPYHYGDNLEEIRTTLLFNLSGSGFKKACEEIEGTVLLVAAAPGVASMFSVLF